METVTVRAYRQVSDPDETPFETIDVEATPEALEEAILGLQGKGARSFDIMASIPVIEKSELNGYFEGDLDAVVGG